MNKDVKGLLKYLLIMFILFFIPIIAMYCGFGVLYYSGRLIALFYLVHAVVLFVLYFVLPIIFTYKAMKNHWSKYLDKFFYNNWLPALILIILISLDFVINHHVYSNWTVFQVLAITSACILPCYWVIFATIVIRRFMNWCINKYPKFYHKWLPTVTLIALICVYYITYHQDCEHNTAWETLLVALMVILPSYCVIYIVIMIRKFINWRKK